MGGPIVGSTNDGPSLCTHYVEERERERETVTVTERTSMLDNFKVGEKEREKESEGHDGLPLYTAHTEESRTRTAS